MPKYFFSVLLALFLCLSCNERLAYSDYKAINNGEWSSVDSIGFEFSEVDSIQPYNVFIHIRNDNNYQFSNLFLIAELESPEGTTQKDTLEYRMAEPNGKWLGKGLGSIKENKLWYKENIVFKDSGVYKITVTHAMRKNGDVEGLNLLRGVTDVGLQIEKNTQ
nr:gliding motility lipoprotein GldH [Allomuricauda sp.]